MRQCYDWNSNILDFMDIKGNKYNLELKGNKTIVLGESATGKTMICKILQGYSKDRNDVKPYATDNIFIMSDENKDKLRIQKNKLVIIDRAEFLLDDEAVNFINADRGYNRYLIFARKPIGLEVSPNYFAELVREEDMFKLTYQFDIKGWT